MMGSTPRGERTAVLTLLEAAPRSALSPRQIRRRLVTAARVAATLSLIDGGDSRIIVVAPHSLGASREALTLEVSSGRWGASAKSQVFREAEAAISEVAAEAKAMGLTSVAARLESFKNEGRLQVAIVQASGKVGEIEFAGSTWAHAFLAAFTALLTAGPFEKVVIVSGGEGVISQAGGLAASIYSKLSNAALEVVGSISGGAERAPEEVELSADGILALVEAAELNRSALRNPSLSSLAERARFFDRDLGDAFSSFLRELSKVLWGIQVGVPIFAHLHICRMRSHVGRLSRALEFLNDQKWLEFELESRGDGLRVRYARTPQAWLAALGTAVEVGVKLMSVLRDESGWRPGVMHSSFILSLLRLYGERDMPLQWHLLFSEVSSVISGRRELSRWESSLSKFLKARRRLERAIGRVPPGAPLFRLWTLCRSSLSPLPSGCSTPEEFVEEVRRWVERVALAREEDCQQARLLAMLMRGEATGEHVRHLLAHSGFVHFAVLDVAPDGESERGVPSFTVYYDERALDLIEARLHRPVPSAEARGKRYYVST